MSVGIELPPLTRVPRLATLAALLAPHPTIGTLPKKVLKEV
jgi:hypothetical protein